MFVEFDLNTLQELNRLSDEQKKQLIKDDEIQIAVNISIKIERHQKVLEDHKYYQVTSNMKLINDISISSIDEQEVVFSINAFNNSDKSELVSIKLDQEKIIEIGSNPYISILRIKISDVKYGQVVEL